MNTKNLVYVGVGLVVGYFLVSYYKKSKDNANSLGSTEPTVDQAKIDKCNQEVANYMATAKFAPSANLEAIKKEMFDACMKRSN